MVWYSHFFKKFPQFIVIHTVKDFGIVSKAEILSCFFDVPADVGNLISGSSAFSKTNFKHLEAEPQGMLKILQARLQHYVNENFQMFKLDLEKAEEPEIKLPTSIGS